jgi:muramoyltetrapeptide carboxypeptidase
LNTPDAQVVFAGRGGYGASDLLPLIPWEKLKGLAPRCLVGFSDITALHSAFWTKLGWSGLHGPMVGSPLWGLNSSEDIAALLSLIEHGQPPRGMLRISPCARAATDSRKALKGWLFGGCFSVLTNLIGTPYLPASLAGAILLFEDTGENCGRLLRYWNQWLQSGLLQGVEGVVWGRFTQLEGTVSEGETRAELSRRSPLPCWTSEDFGHCSPNFPFLIGATAHSVPACRQGAGEQELQWQAPQVSL